MWGFSANLPYMSGYRLLCLAENAVQMLCSQHWARRPIVAPMLHAVTKLTPNAHKPGTHCWRIIASCRRMLRKTLSVKSQIYSIYCASKYAIFVLNKMLIMLYDSLIWLFCCSVETLLIALYYKTVYYNLSNRGDRSLKGSLVTGTHLYIPQWRLVSRFWLAKKAMISQYWPIRLTFNKKLPKNNVRP